VVAVEDHQEGDVADGTESETQREVGHLHCPVYCFDELLICVCLCTFVHVYLIFEILFFDCSLSFLLYSCSCDVLFLD
jgi:hypothetical protein